MATQNGPRVAHPAIGKGPRIYDGDGDALMSRDGDERREVEHLLLVPDEAPSRSRVPDTKPRIRILWGQYLLEDLLAGRYQSLVCAVNSEDNSHGIIAQLATLLPTSQWDEPSITHHAATFDTAGDRVKVLKFDMDAVEVLGILRPAGQHQMTMDYLAKAFKVVSQMI